MIEVRSKDNSYSLKIDSSVFEIDPPTFSPTSYIILTKNNFEANKDKIFEAAGEYETNGIYINCLAAEGKKAFVFKNDFSLLFSPQEPSKELFKLIKQNHPRLNVVFIPELHEPEKWHKEFGVTIFITKRKFNLAKFEVIKEKVIKFNPRRINHAIYLFSNE